METETFIVPDPLEAELRGEFAQLLGEARATQEQIALERKNQTNAKLLRAKQALAEESL